MNLEDLINGAAFANAANNFGIDRDDLVAFAIKTAQSNGQTVEQVLTKMVEADMDMQRKNLQTLGLDRTRDVIAASEFGAGGGDDLTKYNSLEKEKGFDKSSDQSRLKREIEFLQQQSAYQQGDFGEEETDRNYEQKQYRQNSDPYLDDYVVKKNGRIVRFAKDSDGSYKPTRKSDGKILRRMVKSRPGETVNAYNRETREFENRNIPGEQFYPGKRANEPFRPVITGKPEWRAVYQKVNDAINNGTITDPAKLEEALVLRERIKTSLEPGYAKAQEVDRANALIRKERAKPQNERVRRANAERAVLDSIINEVEPANFTDPDFGRLGEVSIQSKGYKKSGKPDWISDTPIIRTDAASFPSAVQVGEYELGSDNTVFFDEVGGNPLALQDVQRAPTVNQPSTDQVANAPNSYKSYGTLEQLVGDKRFSHRSSGQYPQVDINAEIGEFNKRISRVSKIAPNLNRDNRSYQDVSDSLNTVLSLGREQNVRFNQLGSNEKVSDPGPLEVLAKMRYTSPEVSRLANALYQINLVRSSGINLDSKERYFGREAGYYPNGPIGMGPGVDAFGNPAAGGGRTSVDFDAEGPAISLGRDRIQFNESGQMSDYTLSQDLGTANKRVAPQFRTLTGENIEGSAAERADALEDAKFPYIGERKTERVGIEGKRANPNYRFNATGETDPILIESAIRQQSKDRATAKNPRNKDRENQNVYNAQIVNARHNPGVMKLGRGETGFEAPLSRNEFQYANRKGISPDPWDSESSSSRVELSEIQKEAERRQRPALPYGISENPSGIQGPDEGSAFRQVYNKVRNYAKNPRYTRGRQIGYAVAGTGAGVVGLDALVGGERDRREEEVQY